MHKQMLAFVAFVAGVFREAQQLSYDAGAVLLDAIHRLDEDIGTMTEHKARAIGGDTRGQLGLGTILAAFVVVIATFVVLIVVDEFDQSVGTPDSSSLSGAQGDILSGFSSMVSLVEPLLLIAIGVVIIGLIRRVQ